MSVLRAPEDATVLDVAKRPPGSVVREAEMLVRLVPSKDPLQAEVQIDTRDVAEPRRIRRKLDSCRGQRRRSVARGGRGVSTASQPWPN